jgi:KaiC/GvpD/RAD55 family RecA-like ATPase
VRLRAVLRIARWEAVTGAGGFDRRTAAATVLALLAVAALLPTVAAVAALGRAVRADPGTVESILEELSELSSTNVSRVAIDAFDLFEGQFETDTGRVRATIDLCRRLQGEVTTFLVVEQSRDDPDRSTNGLVERSADFVIRTDLHRPEGTSLRTSVEVTKHTNPGGLIDPLQYEIRESGVTILTTESLF